MRRDESAMRVFIPVSDYIAPQAKFYVGCRPYHGRLFPKVVEAACIFFYPEFWAAVDDTQPAKKRLVEMTKECKYRAAVNKTVAGAGNEAGNEAGNALADTAAPNDGTSELTSSLPDLPIIQDKPNADVERAPSRNILSDENVTSFMNFAEAMTIERCAMIAEESKASTTSLHDLKLDKVKAVHESLRSKVEEKDQKGGLMVDKLSRNGLGFFVEMCHGIISDKDSQKKVARKIKYALIASEIHVRHTSIT
ncbi:hypothetical protein F4821DRAFT_25095 [Hypoxylon rubiginosum]|uniref:Uncharacterized protein n=1 Tax=Hypoxylon rubiginosum TaxID=110542 RepID=A0ACC0CM92_9PEZI|nr:hypothetical protein F4821DRAFT_25095 [Hypoxylon rubiginosum]